MTDYRYSLTRAACQIRPTSGDILFVMLNPSTADEHHDDPTIRRCTGFALREGAARFHVVNLYAMRATKPADLFAAEPDERVGPLNDGIIRSWATGIHLKQGKVIAAWGAQPKAAERIKSVRELLGGIPLYALGVTKDGHPRHPLYVRGDQPLVEFAQ